MKYNICIGGDTMANVDYDELIQIRADKSFNIVILISSFIAFASSVILYAADIPIFYAILNFGVALLLVILYQFADRIKPKVKIYILIYITQAIALASFIGGGFTSAFISVLALSNIVAVLFLKKYQSRIVSVITLISMIGMAYFSFQLSPSFYNGDIVLTWGLQLVVFSLAIFVLHVSVYSIKNYLIENISKLEQSIEYSNRLAYYDKLTKLPNEYRFKIDVNKRINQVQSDGYIVFLNLRSLGLINSTLGQKTGDQALIETANFLMKLKSDDLIVARIAGNEFALWINYVSENLLKIKFDYIIGELQKKNSSFNKKMEFYAAYSQFNYGIDTFDECYHRTALTLTYVKRNKIRNLVAYDDGIEFNLRRREAIKDAIDDALHNNRIELYYQPQYDVNNERVTGVEALSRWNDSILGYVSPAEFIPIIESLNIADSFDDYVFKQVCLDYKKIKRKYGDEVSVSINISPSHLINYNIIHSLSEVIDKYDVPASKITLEITEDIIIKGIDLVKPIIGRLKEIGFRISLDDFGSGYSSLNYLTQLELDEIKIDKSFVDQMELNDKIHLIIHNIIGIGHDFDLDIIAEGVETENQSKSLQNMGCGIIQGYLYSKPEKL